MAIFRDFMGESGDRAAEDRRRHRYLIEESIKKNLGDIIAEESIIGQSKDKKIKIPVRGLKEYQFVYGSNSPGVATGTGDEKRGDRVGRDQAQDKPGIGPGAGNKEGEDIYETEITLEDLMEYLFDELNLPYLDKKKFIEVISEQSIKRWGIQRRGIPPRLAKTKSLAEKVKRKQGAKRANQELGLEFDEETRFPFRDEDLRYRRIKEDITRESNAVVICIMDTSGSMYQTKKYLARSFFFLLYQFVLRKYLHVEVAFIAHSTTAKEVSEDEFFHKVESGGTMISSGYAKALELIQERYSPNRWNIYVFHCSDGDNWLEDTDNALDLAQELCNTCNLFGYGEIASQWSAGTIMSEFKMRLRFPNFVMVKITGKEDIWPAFKRLLAVEKVVSEDE
jgi:sporulation protein YhbH